jgi:hypothetical protein
LSKIVILIILLLTIQKVCFAELSLEYSREQSMVNGVTNTRTLYEITTLVTPFTNVPIDILIKSILANYTDTIGHEYYGHGAALRCANNDYKIFYKTKNSYIEYRTQKSADTMADIVSGGYMFEIALKNNEVKNQIINGFNYDSSIFLISSKLSLLNPIISEDKSCDMFKYNKYLNKQKNSFMSDREIRRKSLIQFLDPSILYNCYILSNDLFTSSKGKHSINIIPTLDFNLYPNAITNQINLNTKVKDKFLMVGYEFGESIEGKVSGINFDISNINVNKYLSFSLKSKIVPSCEKSIEVTTYINKLYFRYTHNYIVLTKCDLKDSFGIGFKF